MVNDTSLGPHVAELIGGPQDGAKIRGMNFPLAVFVGRHWQGDGAAAWSNAPSERFPVRYDFECGNFTFHPFQPYQNQGQ